MDKKKRFLKMMKMIESSDGKNTNHPELMSGIHEGDSAQGDFGLMPNTKKEIEARNPGKVFETDEDYADALADKVLDQAEGDESMAAGLWNAGHNKLKQRAPEYLEKQSPEEKIQQVKDNVNYKKYDNMMPEALRPEIPQDKHSFRRIMRVLKKD